MAKQFQRVYQFKITLKDIEPKIWRRIQVPEFFTFWDLHVAIQDAMGWYDAHLHEFVIKNPISKERSHIGIPDAEDAMFDREIIEEVDQKIQKWFFPDNRKALYTYDFGDGWDHEVHLEKILDKDKLVTYPICLAGERACPPEDVGSTPGYERFVKIMSDPNHEEHSEMKAWFGGNYDPDKFDPKKVVFGDPDKAWDERWGEKSIYFE